MVFKNWRSLKCEYVVQNCDCFQLTEYNDVAVWLVNRVAWRGPSPWTTSRKRCNLPVKPYLEVFDFIQAGDGPAKKNANSCEAGLPPSWLSLPSPKPHAWWQVSVGYKWNSGTDRGEPSCCSGRGKVWQSDVVLLTGNIRQRRPLQNNVQQVLGV